MFKCTVFVLLDMYFSIQFSQYVSYVRVFMTEKNLLNFIAATVQNMKRTEETEKMLIK